MEKHEVFFRISDLLPCSMCGRTGVHMTGLIQLLIAAQRGTRIIDYHYTYFEEEL